MTTSGPDLTEAVSSAPLRLAAFADAPEIRALIEDAAGALDAEVQFISAGADVIAVLVAKQPQLILVHLAAMDWRYVVLALKTNPATRKLPVLAFGPANDAALLEQAQQAGCDEVIDEAIFTNEVMGRIRSAVRIENRAELLRQAQLPLPHLAAEAIEKFNQREFFEQHELFEALWRAEAGPVRQMYQGLLQVGVAYLQIQRKNYAGARKLFQRAKQYLNVLPDVCQTVDIRQFKQDAAAAEAELERLGPDRIGEFAPVFFQPIRLK